MMKIDFLLFFVKLNTLDRVLFFAFEDGVFIYSVL
jgi:hypothetical protein